MVEAETAFEGNDGNEPNPFDRVDDHARVLRVRIFPGMPLTAFSTTFQNGTGTNVSAPIEIVSSLRNDPHTNSFAHGDEADESALCRRDVSRRGSAAARPGHRRFSPKGRAPWATRTSENFTELSLEDVTSRFRKRRLSVFLACRPAAG